MANENPLLAICTSNAMSKPLHPQIHIYYNIDIKQIQAEFVVLVEKIFNLCNNNFAKYFITFGGDNGQ